MRSVQNEIVHFALIEGILYFISFCVDGMMSVLTVTYMPLVLNDTHFVLCYDTGR